MGLFVPEAAADGLSDRSVSQTFRQVPLGLTTARGSASDPIVGTCACALAVAFRVLPGMSGAGRRTRFAAVRVHSWVLNFECSSDVSSCILEHLSWVCQSGSCSQTCLCLALECYAVWIIKFTGRFASPAFGQVSLGLSKARGSASDPIVSTCACALSDAVGCCLA